MSHFARVKNGVVTSIIVIEQETLDNAGGWLCPETGEFALADEWVQTSYNTYEGIHKEGGIPMRKNYAGIGYTYDPIKDAFIEQKPYDTWVFNEEKAVYEAPFVKPVDGIWDEEKGEWSNNIKK